jgi:shikimate kinase
MIWLVGMMGAGKTAVGAALADRLGIPHVDTDEEIERRASASIPQLFETVGEPTFRLFEAAVIGDLASDGIDRVVSTGGGAVLDDDSVARMRGTGCVVWLSAEAGDLAARVGDGSGRPLLAGEDTESALGELLERRAPLYEAAAHHRVATEGRDAAAVAAEVEDLCRPA